MYGFIPSATTENAASPPPENRSSRPKIGLPFEERRELGLVDARHRHGGQQPEDDEQAQDVEDPAPDVGRAEGVQQRVEHGISRSGRRTVPWSPARPAARRRRRRRPSRPPRTRRSPRRVGVGVGLGLRSGLAALRRLGRGRLVGGLARLGRGLDVGSAAALALVLAFGSAAAGATSTPRAASGWVGISRTLTTPPAASIFARADAVNASATTNSGDGQLTGAEDLERLVERPDEADGAQDVLVDRDLAAAALSPPWRPSLAGASACSNAPRATSASMAPTFTTSYSTRKRFLKPRSFGMRMWSGVWPPSNQGGMRAAGAGLLALRAAAGGLALAGRDAASDPDARPCASPRRAGDRGVSCLLPGVAVGDLLDGHEEADLADHPAGGGIVGDRARAADAVAGPARGRSPGCARCG